MTNTSSFSHACFVKAKALQCLFSNVILDVRSLLNFAACIFAFCSVSWQILYCSLARSNERIGVAMSEQVEITKYLLCTVKLYQSFLQVLYFLRHFSTYFCVVSLFFVFLNTIWTRTRKYAKSQKYLINILASTSVATYPWPENRENHSKHCCEIIRTRKRHVSTFQLYRSLRNRAFPS